MGVRTIAWTLALTLGVAACSAGSGVDDPPTDGAGTAPVPATDEPAEDQELVVAYGVDQFDIDINRKRLGMYPLNANICEPLAQLTPEFQLAEGLAESWEFAGENTYRFHLRDGVTFHDGSAFDAEDVAYTLDYTVAEPATGYSFLGPDSTTVVDERTVEVTPEQTNLRLVDQIQHPTYAIVAADSDPTVEPVCTGPFRFVEYVPGSHLEVERDPEYWGETAKLERIRFRFIPDAATRVLALKSGEVDVIADVDRAQVADLESTAGVEVVTAPPGQVIVLYLALRGADGEEKITSDPAVRRAIAAALDRNAFVNGVLDGNAEVVNTVNPPSILGDEASLVTGVDHDPEEAARLLAEAGWTEGPDGVRVKDGERLSLSLLYHPARIEQPQAEFVQAQLAEVGIEARIEQLDNATYSERLASGDYDLDIEAPNQNDANPAFLLALRWYSKSQVPNAAFVHLGEGSEYDQLIERIQSSADPDEVRRLAAEAMHLLVDEEVAAVPLAGTYRIYAMKERVEGFTPHPSGINQRWDTVWLSAE